jgi:hypothetical protein
MTRDVIELTGYDVEFIRSKYIETMMEDDIREFKDDNFRNKEAVSINVPGILPLIEKFEFQPNGGIQGKVEGLGGVADGTTIQTSPLIHVQLTLPRGYVLTEDGNYAYELGKPLSEENYLFDMSKKTIDTSNSILITKDVWKKTIQSSTGLQETEIEMAAFRNIGLNVVDENNSTRDLLINLGATTAILLGGATAINMLSHHLTVNVFWV